jgi:ribosome-binding factor A
MSCVANQLRRYDDPRLQWVTITDVDVTPDLKTAWIYFSLIGRPVTTQISTTQASGPGPFLPSDAEVEMAQEALVGVTGALKRAVGDELKLRYTPELQFRFDQSSITGSRIDALLRQAGSKQTDGPK